MDLFSGKNHEISEKTKLETTDIFAAILQQIPPLNFLEMNKIA